MRSCNRKYIPIEQMHNIAPTEIRYGFIILWSWCVVVAFFVVVMVLAVNVLVALVFDGCNVRGDTGLGCGVLVLRY